MAEKIVVCDVLSICYLIVLSIKKNSFSFLMFLF